MSQLARQIRGAKWNLGFCSMAKLVPDVLTESKVTKCSGNWGTLRTLLIDFASFCLDSAGGAERAD